MAPLHRRHSATQTVKGGGQKEVPPSPLSATLIHTPDKGHQHKLERKQLLLDMPDVIRGERGKIQPPRPAEAQEEVEMVDLSEES